MRVRLSLAHGAALALLLMSGTAMADTRVGASVGLNGGASSNPYGSGASDTTSATLNATFVPTMTIGMPTGSARLTAQVSHTEYARRYSATTDYLIAGSISQQISPLASFSGGLSFNSRVRNALYPVVNPGGELDDPDAPIIVDPSARSSFRERTKTLSGNAGLGFSLSPHDSLNLAVRGTRVRFPSSSNLSRSYDSYGGSLSYMRAIAANTSLGASFDVSRHDYVDPNLGNGTQYSPSLRLSTRLAPRLSFNASAGLTFSNTDILGGSRNATSFSGSIGLCHGGDRANFCLNGSRSVSPTSLGGSSHVTALGSSYRYKLTERSTIGASLSYSRAQSVQGLGNVNTDYGQASLTYSRQVLEKLSAVVSLSYSDAFNAGSVRGANYSGSVGLRYRLGDML
jgi:hypothetical protein